MPRGIGYKRRRFCEHHQKYLMCRLWYRLGEGFQCHTCYQKNSRCGNDTALASHVSDLDNTSRPIGTLRAREDVAALLSCAAVMAASSLPLPAIVMLLGFVQSYYWKETAIMATTLLLTTFAKHRVLLRARHSDWNARECRPW